MFQSLEDQYPDILAEFESKIINGEIEPKEWTNSYGKTCIGSVLKGQKKH